MELCCIKVVTCVHMYVKELSFESPRLSIIFALTLLPNPFPISYTLALSRRQVLLRVPL
jgi:hypothetical protein